MWQNSKLYGAKVTFADDREPLVLNYLYDGEEVICVYLNGKILLYIKNIQGDIVSVVNTENNEIVLNYYYDAWGNISYEASESNVGAVMAILVLAATNFSYRGYFSDYETGLYYLQSRYYDPEVGRFINLDDTGKAIATIGDCLGANLYDYCNNNPIKYIDPTGELSVGGKLVIVATSFYIAYKSSLCAQLFVSGFTGNSKKVTNSSSFKNLLKSRLQKSTAIQEYLNIAISGASRRSKKSYSNTYNINFYNYKKNISDADLFLSVGAGCSITFSIKETKKKDKKGYKIYDVTLEMKNDSFDFNDYWDNKTKHTTNAIVVALNNIGYTCQQKNGLKILRGHSK